MRWNPPRILFTSVLVALLGLASGYGQDIPPTPSGPAPPPSQLPPGDGGPQRFLRGGFLDRPRGPLVPPRLGSSSNLILRNLLRRQDASRLIMQLALTEEYSDNFNQENENPQTESQTTLTLGASYRVQNRRRFLTLANTFDVQYQANQQVLQIGLANLALDMGYDFPRLSLSLSDTFVRDDDLEEASTVGAPRERTLFWRNSIAPQVRFQLSRLAALELTYTNIFIAVEEGNQDDSITDQVQAIFQQQFTRALGGGLSYTFSRDDDASSDPAYEFTMAADATYDLTRRISLIATTFWSYNNREPEDTDSLRYGGDISVQYRFSPELSFVLGVGASIFDDETGDPELFLTWQLGLDGTLELASGTRLRLTSSQSIVNTQGEVEDVGIVLQQTFNARLEQDIFRTLRLELFATTAFTDPLESAGADALEGARKAFFWSAGADLLYQLTRTWSLALQYQHRQRDSNLADDEFVENRVLFSITAGFAAL